MVRKKRQPTSYSYSAAADYLGVRYPTIVNWVERGKLKRADTVEGGNHVTADSVEALKKERG